MSYAAIDQSIFQPKVRGLAETFDVHLRNEVGRGPPEPALDEILSSPEAPYTAPMPTDARLRRLCDELVDNPADARDLDDWADEVGMSRRTLTRRFRDETGLSFDAWRERIRLLAALPRLARGEQIEKVAAGVGYGEARALRKMMRRAADPD